MRLKPAAIFAPLLLAAISLPALTLPAHAQSLEARKMQATREAEIARLADLTSHICGTKIATGFAWSTFDADELLQKNVVSWCQAGLDAMEDLCGDPMGKQAVAAKVKALTCAGAATPSASLAPDGTLTFSFSLGPNQNKLLVRGYLEKNL